MQMGASRFSLSFSGVRTVVQNRYGGTALHCMAFGTVDMIPSGAIINVANMLNVYHDNM